MNRKLTALTTLTLLSLLAMSGCATANPEPSSSDKPDSTPTSSTSVIVTAGSQEKLDVCGQLGADVLINYKETDFSEAVLQATDGRGADVILDFIGASYWSKNLKSIAQGGHWVLIGALGGSLVPEVQLFDLMKKYVTLTGTLLTPRSADYKAQLTHEFQDRVKPYFDSGEIRPIIDCVFDLADAEAAQTYMLDNHNIGKILLKSSQ